MSAIDLLTAEIVRAYAATHKISDGGVPRLVSAVRQTLYDLRTGQTPDGGVPANRTPVPAVNPRASLFHDHFVCLARGKRVKMLRWHIQAVHRMTPEDYRRHWGLPYTYPMVAPAYTKLRADVARRQGLGRHERVSRSPPS